MTQNTPCPRCEGKGWVGPVHINRGDKPHEWRERMDCSLCKGTGQIDDDTRAGVEFGKRFRDMRIARGESIRECAKRLGLSTAELSGLEQGRGGMTAWHHPFATRAYVEAQSGQQP
jgi:hypothetical protein